MAPLAHLYESLGVTVSVNLLATIEHDNDSDGDISSISEYSFDARGRFTGRTFDNGTLGIINDTKSYTYTAQSRIATMDRVQDFDDDTNADQTESNTYTYNSEGDVSIVVTELTTGPATALVTTTSVYDEFGDLVSLIVETDNGNNDSVDAISQRTYTYDENGNMLMLVHETDNDPGNEAIDNKVIDVNTYDASGNQLTWQQSTYGDDETVDSTKSMVRTYGAVGNLLTETITHDADGAGSGGTSYSELVTNTYDSSNNLVISTVVKRQNGVDVSFRQRTTNSFSGDGTLLLSSLRETDSNLNEMYDDGSARSTYTYGTHGNWLTQLHENDFDGDEVPDATSSSVHEYMLLNDGMFSLLYHYFDTSVVNN